jgi:hypothetical protein
MNYTNAATREVRDAVGRMSDRLHVVDESLRSVLEKHPFLSLSCAVGLGFLAARWIARRS